MTLIFVHELGHTLAAIIIKIKVLKIVLFPFGGCTKLEYDINSSSIKEIIIIISGPLLQLLFTLLIRNYYSVSPYFFTYSYFILLINLLPIYPLDGGKLLNELLTLFFPYYYCLKYSLLVSYIILFLLITINILYIRSFLIFIIFLSMFTELLKQIKQSSFYYNKFLLERYLKNYSSNKTKYINDIKKLRKNYNSIIVSNNNVLNEKEFLGNYFNK